MQLNDLGGKPVDLTCDRGFMVAADVAGFTLTRELLNGNGIGPAQSDRHFDDDADKNCFLHVTRDLTSGIRLGAMGYTGRTAVSGIHNRTAMLGLDATMSYGALELNGGPSGIRRLERHIFRWSAEAAYDLKQESWRWSFGLVTAF